MTLTPSEVPAKALILAVMTSQLHVRANRRRHLVPRSTAGLLVGAAVLLVLGSTGGAVAGNLITGRQIKNGTITSADIKNMTITRSDLARSARPRAGAAGQAGPAGPAGIQGATGERGAAGPAGAVGPAGPRGFSAWDAIPGGQTVTGPINIVRSASVGFHFLPSGPLQDMAHFVLPARAPVKLVADDIGFRANPIVDPRQVDPSCTGSVADPTAPPGRVCFYIGGNVGATNVTGTTADLADRSFGLYWEVSPNPNADFVSISGSWAYTAP